MRLKDRKEVGCARRRNHKTKTAAQPSNIYTPTIESMADVHPPYAYIPM
jgi:hypothetical protein